MLGLSEELRDRCINLRVLNLGGGNVDTGTPMGGMVFTIMAALAQMELEIKRERITDSVSKRRAAGKDLGGRRERFTNSQIETPAASSQPANRPPRSHVIWACPGRPYTGAPLGSKHSTGQPPRANDSRNPPTEVTHQILAGKGQL